MNCIYKEMAVVTLYNIIILIFTSHFFMLYFTIYYYFISYCFVHMVLFYIILFLLYLFFLLFLVSLSFVFIFILLYISMLYIILSIYILIWFYFYISDSTLSRIVSFQKTNDVKVDVAVILQRYGLKQHLPTIRRNRTF